MSSFVCRLCLNDSKLIDLFDSRLTNSAQLKKCILLGTGVDICRTDKVSTYICHLCSEIAIFLYKYRKNAVANDKALKEFANQHFKEPPTHTKDVVPLNNQILNSFEKEASRTEVPEQNDTVKTFENRKKPPQTNIAVHPTIIQLIKKNPRLKIPNDLLKYDIQPKIALDKNEVEQWKPPTPKRSVTPENKPVSAMERFKMKFPGINIMRISSNSNTENNVGNSDVNKGGNSKESIVRSISNEDKIGITENARKRKASVSEDVISEFAIPAMKQRLNEVDENSVKVSKTIENKFKSFESKESKVNVSEEKVKITEAKLKTESKVKFNNDIKINNRVVNKTKDLSVTKHKKRRDRTTDNEDGKLEKTLPKLKISLRKSTESTNETPTVSVVDSVMDTITAVIQKTCPPPTPPTTFIAPPPVIANIVDNKMDTSESDTEKIAPKKLNKNKKIFDSDSEDCDSIGANDLVIDDIYDDDLPVDDSLADDPLVDDTLVDDPLVDDPLPADKIPHDGLPKARIPKERIFEDKVDETVLDALLDTFEEELALHCVHCNKMFASPFQLKCHERTHKNCTICKAVFRSNEALRHHHTEVCFKVVLSNPPDVQLTRIDEDPEMLRQYHYIFDSTTETSEADTNVFYISDDDDDVVCVEDLGDRSNTGLDVSQNREYQHIKNVFSKYKDLKIQLATKSRYTEMKPQMHVRFNSKGQIVLENMFPELKIYRVPVELIAKTTSFAYISFSKKQSEAKELYNWSKEPVISLSEKHPLRKMTDANSVKKTGNKLLNAMNQTTLQPFLITAPNQQTVATPSMNISGTSINISTPPVNINIQNSAMPVNINASNLTSVLNATPVNKNIPNLTPISTNISNVTPVATSTPNIITTPTNTNTPNLATVMVNTSNLITTPVVNRDMPDLTTPVNVTTLNSTIPIMTNLTIPASNNMLTTPSNLTTAITDISNFASTSAMNKSTSAISNLTPPPVNRNVLNFTVNRNMSNFTTPVSLATVNTNTSNLFAMPVSMSNLAPPTNQSAINRSLSEAVMDLLDEAVPSTSGTNDAYAQQQRAGKENLSLRVKTPWELNNINA